MRMSPEFSSTRSPDELRALLAPGEVALSYELAHQFAQADAIGGQPPTLRNSVEWDGDWISGPLHVAPDFVGSKLTGIGAGGARGSLGDQFNQALQVPGADHLLLTSHRFAVTGGLSRGWSLSSTQTILFSVDRRAVRRIAVASRLLQRGRIRVDFADGSWAMAMMGMFRRSAARRLINVFEGRPG